MILWTKFSQKGCFRSKIKKWYHHWGPHIRINLGTKFQLKLTILIFWTKFSQKRYFRLETEKSHLYVRPWLLRTILNLSARDRHTQRYFSISSPSSGRDKYYITVLFQQFTKTLNLFFSLSSVKYHVCWKPLHSANFYMTVVCNETATHKVSFGIPALFQFFLHLK